MKNNNHICNLPWSLAQKEYESMFTKISGHLNFVEKIPFQVFNGDPTLEYIRTSFAAPVASFVYRLGVGANIMSFIGLFFAIMSFLAGTKIELLFLFVLASLVCDGLDGVVARVSGTASKSGEIVDLCCDTLGSVFIIFSMVKNFGMPLEFGLTLIVTLVPYTIISALKSEKYIQKSRSIGSRISVGFIVILLSLLASLNLISLYIFKQAVTVLYSSISFMLFTSIIHSLFIFVMSKKNI